MDYTITLLIYAGFMKTVLRIYTKSTLYTLNSQLQNALKSLQGIKKIKREEQQNGNKRVEEINKTGTPFNFYIVYF